jgi:hypothetical protein
MVLHAIRRAILWLLVPCCLLHAQKPNDTLSPAAPLPGVIALAAAQQIRLQGIAAPIAAPTLAPGDKITALFTLSDSGQAAQWLAEVTIVPLTQEERGAKPSWSVIYTGGGNEFHLDSPPAAYALRMFGPVLREPALADGWPERRARFTLSEDFLVFGFDRMCELALRLRERGEEIRMGFTTGPFPPDQIAWDKAWAARTGFTRADELVCAKQGFATVEFLMLADRTPGFRDIVTAAVKKPSLWTAVRRMNFGLFFNYDWKRLIRDDGAKYGVKDPVYTLPFALTVFGTHVANGAWIVTAARPPLLACAGVIGLIIEPPDSPSKRLEMRVIAA